MNVPQAANSDTFQLYIGGEQLTSAQGTGLMGPVQIWSGQTLTVKSTTVSPGKKAVLYGQIDAEGKQPSGIFPAISGGVVTTNSGSSPTFLAPVTSYPSNNAGTITYNITSSTMQAIDSTNLSTGQFVAPSSGNIVVRCLLAWTISSNLAMFLGLLDAAGSQYGSSIGMGRTGSPVTSQLTWFINGLKPGLAYTLFLAAAISGSGTGYVYAQGGTGTATPSTLAAPGCPVTITVEAA